jgi:uncharacterized protein
VDVFDFLTTPARQSATLKRIGHRPWPLPTRPWLMAQTWKQLLFAHWPAPLDHVRPHVPEPLDVDTFDGTAWVGVTPFRLSGLRVRALPPAPLLSTFLELNARTYVTLEGKAGIWFFSLDASSRLAVEAARRGYRLPYFNARMSALQVNGGVRYASERTSRRARPAVFSARYGPEGGLFAARPGSLDHFLTERYCLYAVEDGEIFRGEIHHGPWPIQTAGAEIERNTMAPPGIDTNGEPLLHFAARQDVVIWPLEHAANASNRKHSKR